MILASPILAAGVGGEVVAGLGQPKGLERVEAMMWLGSCLA